MKPWFVYMVECADGSLYTGITTDLDRRVQEHNSGNASTAANYTRSRRPVTLRYCEQQASRSDATRRELQIKKLSREQKLQLVSTAATTT